MMGDRDSDEAVVEQSCGWAAIRKMEHQTD